MALTASPPAAATLKDVSWDEKIVPSLRKRLESESLAISKRMSATSMATSEDGTQQRFPSGSARMPQHQQEYTLKQQGEGLGQTRSSESSSRTATATGRVTPSGIPRPSLNYARPLADASNINYATRQMSNGHGTANGKGYVGMGVGVGGYRPRTLSQPFAFDGENAAGGSGKVAKRPAKSNTQMQAQAQTSTAAQVAANMLPTPASSRSNSPTGPPNGLHHINTNGQTGGGGARPLASGTGGMSPELDDDYRVNGRGRTTPTYARPFQHEYGEKEERDDAQEYDYEDRWGGEANADVDVDDANANANANASRSTVDVDFPSYRHHNGIIEESAPFALANSSAVSQEESTFRADSPVRPSMEERPFEHWYRGDVSRNGGVGELRIGSRMEMLEIANYGHKLRNKNAFGRLRAQSIGARESVVIDEEDTIGHPLVLDEAPLTDIEGDTETDREQSAGRSNTDLPRRIAANYAALQTNGMLDKNMLSTSKPRQPSQIPRAAPVARTASEPLQTLMASSSSQIPPTTRSRSQARIPHSHSVATTSAAQQNQATPASPAQKRGRGKSPAGLAGTGTGTPAKKKPAATQQKRSKSSTGLDVRVQPREVAEYPDVPDGIGSMADAIPSWTQPKKAGNWDDVVLPVVARKMGLDDQYEEADGSPKQRRQSEEVIPPQPGTFGIDDSKRRQRYDPKTGKMIYTEDPSSPVVNNRSSTQKRRSSQQQPNGNANTMLGKRMSSQQQSANNVQGRLGAKNGLDERPVSPAPFSQYATINADAQEQMVLEPEQVEKNRKCCGCVIM